MVKPWKASLGIGHGQFHLCAPSCVFGLLACHAKFPWSLVMIMLVLGLLGFSLAFGSAPEVEVLFGSKGPSISLPDGRRLGTTWHPDADPEFVAIFMATVPCKSFLFHTVSSGKTHLFSFFQTWGTVATCGRRWRKEGKLDPPADQAHSSFAMIKWWCSHMGLLKTISPTCHPS